jgi:ferredoxin-NADP reductase
MNVLHSLQDNTLRYASQTLNQQRENHIAFQAAYMKILYDSPSRRWGHSPNHSPRYVLVTHYTLRHHTVFFYPERTPERDLIFIAGGIGITPYISIMNTYCHQNYAGRISLFYSNQTLAQTIFKSDLDTLCHTHQNVTVIYHITREPLTDTLYRMGRLSGNIICEGIQHPQTSDFFISGSIDFTKTMWKGLRNAGIKDAQLYTEGFF